MPSRYPGVPAVIVFTSVMFVLQNVASGFTRRQRAGPWPDEAGLTDNGHFYASGCHLAGDIEFALTPIMDALGHSLLIKP